MKTKVLFTHLNLSAGFYYVRYFDGQTTTIEKIVIQK